MKSDELTKAGQQSLATSLSGKIAGVQITSQGGQVGASQNIVVRGNSSFGNNQPLIVGMVCLSLMITRKVPL